MRSWFILFGVLLSASLATAETNVEPELCYMKIRAAIKAGEETGKYQLDDENCAKYKRGYDSIYGDPLRIKLRGEPESQMPSSREVLKDIGGTRDACWDALIKAKYDRKTFFNNDACKVYLDHIVGEDCTKLMNSIYMTDFPIQQVPREKWIVCQSYR